MADGKLTFTFAKKTTKRQLDSGSSSQFQHESAESNQERDFVVAVSDKEIESVVPQKVKTEYIIPMKKKSVLGFGRGIKDVAAGNECQTSVSQEDKEAAEAIMKDLHNTENEMGFGDSQLIPMIRRNRTVGEDEATALANDSATLPEQSNLDDYDNMPIEQFGAALIRGMGWKEGAPIGLTNKEVVKPIEYVRRQPGQGLGAVSKQVNVGKLKKLGDKDKYKTLYDKDGRVRHVRELDEELSEAPPNEMKVGAFVHVVAGFHKGFYGKVTSLDEDTAHAVVEVPNMKRPLAVSQHNLEVVDKTAYSEGLRQSKEETSGGDRNGQNKHGQQESVKSKHRQSSPHKSSKKTSKSKRSDEDHWLHPNIRVRVVSKHYRKGAFYNEKVSIVDVVSADTCICKTDDKELLEDVRQDMLETVVPKQSDSLVCIVLGKQQGQLGRLVEKNKSKCQAIVQLLQDQSAVRLDYDQLAEYTGNPDTVDDVY